MKKRIVYGRKWTVLPRNHGRSNTGPYRLTWGDNSGACLSFRIYGGVCFVEFSTRPMLEVGFIIIKALVFFVNTTAMTNL
jgi:hypothetical protein